MGQGYPVDFGVAGAEYVMGFDAIPVFVGGICVCIPSIGPPTPVAIRLRARLDQATQKATNAEKTTIELFGKSGEIGQTGSSQQPD